MIEKILRQDGQQIKELLLPTMDIRNADDLVYLNIKAFNKQRSGLTVKCLEISHYAYSSRCAKTRAQDFFEKLIIKFEKPAPKKPGVYAGLRKRIENDITSAIIAVITR